MRISRRPPDMKMKIAALGLLLGTSVSLRAAALPNGKRNRTQEAQGGHKKHKKDLMLRIFCAFCALICAFCVPFPWATPLAAQTPGDSPEAHVALARTAAGEDYQ